MFSGPSFIFTSPYPFYIDFTIASFKYEIDVINFFASRAVALLQLLF